jgi:hypothetical protein
LVKAFWVTSFLLAMTLLALPLRALQSVDAEKGPVSVEVDSISLGNVGSDSVSFTVQSHVVSTRTLRVRRIRFEQMGLGNLPVYLDPLEEKLSLTAGAPLGLPAIPVTVFYRDLESLAPLQQAVSDGQATVHGYARVDLDLNIVERFASNHWNAHADMPIQVNVPVEIPGGFIGRAAALVALSAAQVALNIGRSSLNPLRQSEAGEDALRLAYTPSLVVAESRYALMRGQQRVEIVVRQPGFRIAADQFVLTGEMMEPCKYDIEVATALKTGEASLLEDSRELLVWPAGAQLDAGSARSLARGSIQVVHEPKQTESTEVATADNHIKVRICRRDSNSNYAVLRFTQPGDQGTPIKASPTQENHGQLWDRLAVFRLNDQGQLEVVETPAHREGDRIRVEDPLDSSTFGSVLIAEDGVAGMLQDERSGMMLRSKW